MQAEHINGLGSSFARPSGHTCVSNLSGAQRQCDFWPDMSPCHRTVTLWQSEMSALTNPQTPPLLLRSLKSRCSLHCRWQAPRCVNDLGAQFHSSYCGSLISHGEVPDINAFPHRRSTDGDVSKRVSVAHEARLERYVFTHRLSRKHSSEAQ